MKSDEDYFTQRAEEERSAAQNATDDDAKIVHLELADAYHELSEALERAHAPSFSSQTPAQNGK